MTLWCSTAAKRDLPIAETILTKNSFMWKEARRAWMGVIVQAFMKEYDTKLQLAKVSCYST